MQVSNLVWAIAGNGFDTKLIMQNVGDTRIAFVMATGLPGPTDIALESDEHFILHTGSAPLTVVGMDVDGFTMYVRSLGPKFGQLALSFA